MTINEVVKLASLIVSIVSLAVSSYALGYASVEYDGQGGTTDEPRGTQALRQGNAA